MTFSINSYGIKEVEFSPNLWEQYDQCEVLHNIMMSYSMHSIQHRTGDVKMGKADHPNIEIYEEENYWKTGYNFKLVKNNTDALFVMSHTNLDLANGLLIKPTKIMEDYIVSRSQFCFCIEPGEFRGVYTKPYAGFKRGGQANT